MNEGAPAHRGLAIRWRLTIWITAAFILTLAAIFVSLRVALGQILFDDVETELAENFDKPYGRMLIADAHDPAELSAIVSEFPFPITVRGPDGVFLAGNIAAEPSQMTLSDEEIIEVAFEGQVLDENVTLNDEDFRVRTAGVTVGDFVLILQVGRSTQAIEDVMQALNTIVIGGGALGSLLVLAVGYTLARGALRPIEKITHTAADIEASDLTQRIGVHGEPAEVQHLAETFDAMLARLENAFGQQRNFVMDVSHELRTPLTGLRGNIDVMLMDKTLDTDTRAQLEKMSSEVGRLIRLTSNLLYLAHAEAGRDIARWPIRLDDLCLEVIPQARGLRTDVELSLDCEEQVVVSGDRDLLKQLVLNLVDNAVRYSPEGGEVVVSLEQRGEAVELTVSDQGPGIPEQQLERIFERFYQGSDSESRTVGGLGIGLAISRWIAQAHGGEIRAENAVGRGSRFIVTLPLSHEAEG